MCIRRCQRNIIPWWSRRHEPPHLVIECHLHAPRGHQVSSRSHRYVILDAPPPAGTSIPESPGITLAYRWTSMKKDCGRVYALAGLTLAALLLASPASAQYKPRPLNDPATGEAFHIEGSVSWCRPGADMNVASEGLGIPGSTIDFKKDLGMTDQSF